MMRSQVGKSCQGISAPEKTLLTTARPHMRPKPLPVQKRT
jgi:hypothetical protein